MNRQDYDSIPDEAIPIIQRANGAVEEAVPPSTATDEVATARRLTEEANRLVSEAGQAQERAIQILLQRRKEIDAQLVEFGYAPETALITVHTNAVPTGGYTFAAPVSAPVTDKPKESAKDEKQCPLCKISGHDLRSHRSQGARKKAFTAEELKKLAK